MGNMPPIGSDDPTWPNAITPPPQPVRQKPYPSAQPLPLPPPPQPVRQSYGPYRSPVRGLASASRATLGLAQLIPLALGIIESLLIIRIVLLVLAANPDAGFSSLIYSWTAPFVAPFQGVFPNVVGSQGPTLDIAAILAMIVYALLARAVGAILRVFARL